MDTFEEALCRLDRYIWYMAHRFGTSIKGQEIEDLHQEGTIKLYEIYSSERYTGKQANELDAIFKISLNNMLKDLYTKSKRHSQVIVPMEGDLEFPGYSYDAFADVYLAYHKDALSRQLSLDSVRLLEALLDPTPAIYHMYNITVMRRKALKSQGMNVRVPAKITHEIVGYVLGFSLTKTKNLIRELKEVWKTECQQVKGSYKQSAVTY